MMAAKENGDGPQATHARQKLSELRESLREARTSDDADQVHSALIEAVEGLIAHVEKQARIIDDLCSDMGHKQGIVTRIGGGDY